MNYQNMSYLATNVGIGIALFVYQVQVKASDFWGIDSTVIDLRFWVHNSPVAKTSGCDSSSEPASALSASTIGVGGAAAAAAVAIGQGLNAA